jgi:hypothetical protein
MLIRKDTGQTNDSAAATVFSITELLEVILLEFGIDLAGMKSLFVLKCVNKTFKHTTKKSPKLRRVMFRRGTDRPEDTVPVLNPLPLDRSINRVLYPAILWNWKADAGESGPWCTRRLPNTGFTFTHRADPGLSEFPVMAPGSWR